EQAVDSELRSLELASQDQSRYLRLTETLSEFRSKLRVRAETLDTMDRQKILRLVVQEILVGSDTIRIRHSIPANDSGLGGHDGLAAPADRAAGTGMQSYLLRTGSHDDSLRRYPPHDLQGIVRKGRHQSFERFREMRHVSGEVTRGVYSRSRVEA